MRAKAERQNVKFENSQAQRWNEYNFLSKRLLILLPFAFCLLPFAFRASAHEPITTKVRFNKEVIRIFERSCLGCHRPNGMSPMSLATYEEARPWAKAIKEEVLERRMPVWHAVKGYGEFRNAPLLTQREMDLLVNWVEGGAPKGDDKDYPQRAVYSDDWTLGKPDLILQLPKEQQIASDADETRTFILPVNLPVDRWLRALDLRPTNGAVVLSASIHIQAAKSPETQPAIFTWMPGQKAIALPDGTARLLPANASLLVKVHYRGNGEAAGKDRGKIGLYFAASKPAKQLRDLAITNPDASIPANAAAQQIKLSYTLPEDTEAVAVRPRANPLMVSFQASAILPEGTEKVLLWSRGSKFDWQPTYFFKQNIALPKGTRLEITAYFDNSDNNPANPNDPPKPLRWSDISEEPLCVFLMAGNRSTTD